MVSKYCTNYKEPNIFIYFAENVTVCTVQNAESLQALNCKVLTNWIFKRYPKIAKSSCSIKRPRTFKVRWDKPMFLKAKENKNKTNKHKKPLFISNSELAILKQIKNGVQSKWRFTWGTNWWEQSWECSWNLQKDCLGPGSIDGGI